MSILTISREYGSGGREIGQAVSKLLGYDYINKERILADIRATGPKWEQWAKDLDEHCPTVWEKYDWSFRGFAALIQSTILSRALNDRAVLMGRGGNFLLKDVSYAFRIRVHAPLEARIERIMKREGVDKETARWLCEKTDSERSCFIHAIYGRRWDDAAEYDTVFDAGKQAIDDIVQVAKQALTERDKLNTPEARKTLEMRALAAKVKAGIATDPKFFIPTLDVSHDGTAIVLRGVTHSPKEHKRIEEAAQSIAAGVPVKCELHYRK